MQLTCRRLTIIELAFGCRDNLLHRLNKIKHINSKKIFTLTENGYIKQEKIINHIKGMHPRHPIIPQCYTHTHPFNGPFSGTTQVSRYQKGKTNLDFTEARDSEWQWHQLGYMQVCTSTPPLCFLQAICPSCRPTNSVKALKATVLRKHKRMTLTITQKYLISCCRKLVATGRTDLALI